MKILIVDDEPDILDLLAYNLEREGYAVIRAVDGESALRLAAEQQPDLILLDIMMPRMDGVEACRRIRLLPGGDQPFIIFLTARGEEYSEIAGLEAGADDYVTKPIKPRLLITRLQAVMRRGRAESEPASGGSSEMVIGDLEILPEEYIVRIKGVSLSLPKKEFELLHFMATQPGKVFTREALLENVWGDNVHVVDRTIDVHIRKLREKIGKQWIKTVQGVGYKFEGRR
jgi:two-component system, OmpR family, alkaline phosphatase synthesis response regulator PhoP